MIKTGEIYASSRAITSPASKQYTAHAPSAQLVPAQNIRSTARSTVANYGALCHVIQSADERRVWSMMSELAVDERI